MGCFAAILLTSSCTADSPEETKTENQIAPTKIPNTGTELSSNGEPIPDGEPIPSEEPIPDGDPTPDGDPIKDISH